MENFIEGDNKYVESPLKLNTRALCLSLQDIELLVEVLAKNSKFLAEVDPEITKTIEQ